MRVLFIVVLSLISFCFKGDRQLCFSQNNSKLATCNHEHPISPGLFFKNELKGEHIDITEYYNDVEELTCSAQTATIIKYFSGINYALILLFLITLFKNKISFHWNQTFPSTEKYILQRVLRL